MSLKEIFSSGGGTQSICATVLILQGKFPKLFKQAIQLDKEIRKKDSHAFLHSTAQPLEKVDLTQEDDLFSGSCPSGECFL